MYKLYTTLINYIYIQYKHIYIYTYINNVYQARPFHLSRQICSTSLLCCSSLSFRKAILPALFARAQKTLRAPELESSELRSTKRPQICCVKGSLAAFLTIPSPGRRSSA